MSTTATPDLSTPEQSRSRTSAVLSAALLVVAGVFIVIAAATTIDIPSGAPTETTSLETVRAVVENRDLYITTAVTSFLGLGLFVAGLPALVDLARGRRGRLAVTGGTLTTLGLLAGAGLSTLAFAVLFVGSSGTVDEATGAELWTYASSSDLFSYFALGGFLLSLVGLVLLGAGLITAHRTPRWLGILAIVAGVLYVAGQIAAPYPFTIICFLPLGALALVGGVLRLRSSQA